MGFNLLLLEESYITLPCASTQWSLPLYLHLLKLLDVALARKVPSEVRLQLEGRLFHSQSPLHRSARDAITRAE